MAWFSTDESVWEAACSDLPRPWPEAFTRMDLRYHENRHRMKVAPFPGRVALSNRWGWTDRKVRNLLDADDWHDPQRPVAREDLRGKWDGKVQHAANTPPTPRPTACQQDNEPTPVVEQNPPTACQHDVQQPANSVSIARVSSLTTGTTEPREPLLEIPAATATGHAQQVGMFGALTQPEPPKAIEPEPTAIEPKPAKAKRGKAGASRAKEPVWGYHEAIDAWDRAWAEEQGGTVYPWIKKGQYADWKHVKTWLSAANISRESDVPGGIDRIYGAAVAYLRAVEAGAAFPRNERPNIPRFAKDIAQWLQVDPNERPRIAGRIDPNEETREAMRRAVQRMEELEAAK